MHSLYGMHNYKTILVLDYYVDIKKRQEFYMVLNQNNSDQVILYDIEKNNI